MRKDSIAIRLGMAFTFLIAILTGIGWFGVARMGRLNADLNGMVAQQWVKFQLAREIEFYTRQNNQISEDILLAQSESPSATAASKALLGNRAENRRIVDQLCAQLERVLDSPQEEALFSAMERTRVPFAQSATRALDLALQNKPAQARDLRLKETTSLRDRYYRARDNFVQYEERQVNDAKSLRESKYAEAHRVATFMVFLAVLTAAILAVFVTVRLTQEISRREQVEADILALNGGLETKVDERTKELALAKEQLEAEIVERRETEAALRRSEEHFRSLVENSPHGILRITPDGLIQQANKALLDMLGYGSEAEILGLRTGTDLFLSTAEHRKVLEQFGSLNAVNGVEVEWKRKDGKPITVRYARHTIRDAKGDVLHKEIIVEDISEKRILEQQLRQAQKMEAVGRLAGGIAHDFNNLLGVIIGYSELILDQELPSESVRDQVEQINRAGDRARSLTRQLLAFSRKQVLETEVLDLNCIVADMQKMFPSLLGEDVEVLISLEPGLGRVRADQSQIEQVIMNLVANARDAMPDGGRFVLETRNIDVDIAGAAARSGMVPGTYVTLSVADSGIGMDNETLSHIFEPFFTTKARGQGTGLGLATVYGIVKQSGGYVLAESEPGRGSCFKIYLPRTDQAAQPKRIPEAATRTPKRMEAILLVEDEESLRSLIRILLKGGGYTVLEASNAKEALDLAAQYDAPIDILLTDVVMPGMNGRALADKLSAARPKMKVVYMSGHTDILSSDFVGSNLKLLQKPFTRDALLRTLAEVLEVRPDQNGMAEFLTRLSLPLSRT